MTHAFVEPRGNRGAHVHLKVVPGGSRNEIVGLHGDRLRVKVAAPPEDGKANKAVVALLADALHIPKGALRIVRGAATPLKTIEVSGLAAADVGRLLYEETE